MYCIHHCESERLRRDGGESEEGFTVQVAPVNVAQGKRYFPLCKCVCKCLVLDFDWGRTGKEGKRGCYKISFS